MLRRAVRGMRMKVGLPLSAFRGVALRLVVGSHAAPALAVVLDHQDAALSVPLLVGDDGSEAMALWKAWGRVLGLPLLLEDEAGELREAFVRLGALAIGAPRQRRRRRSALKRRRPSILMRRRMGRPLGGASVHRGEREIIARN